MKVNNKTVGIIVNPNSGKDIRRLVSSAFVVPQQYKSNELIKLYEGLSSQGVNKVFIMPDFSDVSKRLSLHVRIAKQKNQRLYS